MHALCPGTLFFRTTAFPPTLHRRGHAKVKALRPAHPEEALRVRSNPPCRSYPSVPAPALPEAQDTQLVSLVQGAGQYG